MKKSLPFLLLFAIIALGSSNKQAIGTKVGQVAPDIVQTGTNGKVLKLSDNLGKLVLIDFWASWCKPCRMQNPNVVNLYQKYKDAKFNSAKGFTVFSVSLDQQKEPWLNAIKSDKLEWPNHVSDLKGWSNAASKKYGVASIPTTYLIDGNGIIIGKNLTHQQLEYELAKRKVN